MRRPGRAAPLPGPLARKRGIHTRLRALAPPRRPDSLGAALISWSSQFVGQGDELCAREAVEFELRVDDLD